MDPYALPESELSPIFLNEWRDLFDYKTATTRTRLKRRKRGYWRLLRKSKIATPLSSAAQKGELGSVTANIALDAIRRYLGFLCKPRTDGGLGIAKSDVMTLAWLAVPDAVNAFLEFMTQRSDGIVHWGQRGFASFVCSLTSKEYGFLTQQPHFIERLNIPIVHGSFQEMCAETHEIASEWRCKAANFSRNPEEPIRGLLALEEPLAPLLRAIAKLDSAAAESLPGSVDEAVHKRDALLLTILTANPLRRRNLMLMTYFEDGSGNLYRREDGWRLRYEPSDFKNERGAASGPYDVPLPPDASWRIEEYLDEFRPRLLQHNPDAPWVMPSRRSTLWQSLTKQVEKITRRFVAETPGFGPHAVRHLVATDYLRKHPNDYPTVAQLLNDRLETVIAEYAHLKHDDSFGRWQEHLRAIPKN
ncbi:integrase [Paraburkholderia sp. Clong3]|uniref:hypothetical protein n=1 Tax=Paraburkholderia sp. Clong3 TaxID=2991061 RepID=UPI003D1A87E5